MGLAAVLAGCNRTRTPTGAAPQMPVAQAQFDTESGPFAAGKKVFAANGCLRCHAVNGAGGPMAGGPMGGMPMPGGPMGPGGPPGAGGPPQAGSPPGTGEPPMPAGAPSAGGGGPPMAGGPPGPGGPGGFMGRMGRGPDLGKVAFDPAHTPEWLAEHVRNPKAHRPASRMPPYEGKINDDDMKVLVDFLASLK
jgi:cytochrome c2